MRATKKPETVEGDVDGDGAAGEVGAEDVCGAGEVGAVDVCEAG